MEVGVKPTTTLADSPGPRLNGVVTVLVVPPESFLRILVTEKGAERPPRLVIFAVPTEDWYLILKILVAVDPTGTSPKSHDVGLTLKMSTPKPPTGRLITGMPPAMVIVPVNFPTPEGVNLTSKVVDPDVPTPPTDRAKISPPTMLNSGQLQGGARMGLTVTKVRVVTLTVTVRSFDCPTPTAPKFNLSGLTEMVSAKTNPGSRKNNAAETVILIQRIIL